jgi:hypothetical protein
VIKGMKTIHSSGLEGALDNHDSLKLIIRKARNDLFNDFSFQFSVPQPVGRNADEHGVSLKDLLPFTTAIGVIPMHLMM